MSRDSRTALLMVSGLALYFYFYARQKKSGSGPRGGSGVATTAREWADLMLGPGAIVGYPATTRYADNYGGQDPKAWTEQQRALTTRLSGRGA